ncbi:unnamed protein product [Closterium sp. Yama58-4]|nr:unnamed protein product [Closterium sp. Yama58-4]
MARDGMAQQLLPTQCERLHSPPSLRPNQPPRNPPPWPAYEPATIHKLPRDVIAKIFSHLSVADRCSVSLVCRLWFRYERLLPHYMQSEVSAAELRFVLRRFPLIRTLRIRFFGPTVLPGAPREQRAEDRHHKRPGGGRVGVGEITGAGDGGTAAATPAASAPPAPVPAFPISDADVLDGSAIVRLLSLNTPLQIQQVAGTQVEYLCICNCGEFEIHQGLRTYMCDTIATWGRSIRHIEMHDPMPSADEFWKCVEGHPALSKVTVFRCTHLTDGFLRHVAKCAALKEISIASCPNVSGGGFAELAEKCPGLEGMVLEDLSLSVVAKKARSAPGGGRAGGGGAGGGLGEGAGGGVGEGRVGLDGRAAEGEAEWGGGGAGEDVRMGEGGEEAERGAGGMEGGEWREGDRAEESLRRTGEEDAAVRVARADGIGAMRAGEGASEVDGWGAVVGARGEAEAGTEVQLRADGTAAAGRGGSLAASFPNLSSLKLINCALDAHWLEMFGGQLPALRRLTVMACPDPLDRFFLTAAWTAARLESVEIIDCEGVSDRASHFISIHYPLTCPIPPPPLAPPMSAHREISEAGLIPPPTCFLVRFFILPSHMPIPPCLLPAGRSQRQGSSPWCSRAITCSTCASLASAPPTLSCNMCIPAFLLPSCREISEAGLIPLVRSCHRLQHMCFSGFRASHLSDLLLHTIASHCPLLTTLSLRACNGVTTHGVLRVLQGCGRIARCQLARCQEVDEEWVVRVAREVGEARGRGTGGSRGDGEMPVIEVS